MNLHQNLHSYLTDWKKKTLDNTETHSLDSGMQNIQIYPELGYTGLAIAISFICCENKNLISQKKKKTGIIKCNLLIFIFFFAINWLMWYNSPGLFE